MFDYNCLCNVTKERIKSVSCHYLVNIICILLHVREFSIWTTWQEKTTEEYEPRQQLSLKQIAAFARKIYQHISYRPHCKDTKLPYK